MLANRFTPVRPGNPFASNNWVPVAPADAKKPPEGGFFMEGKNSADYFSAALRRPFRVFIGASTTKLLASQDGMLPPGSVCTW